MVFFLGGVTYTEIAALRWVSRQNKGGFLGRSGLCGSLSEWTTRVGYTGRKFLIATTGIINGNSIIDSIAGIGGTVAKEAGI